MKRYDIELLRQWKRNPMRKPLILQGARQVGKTWLMLQFAKEEYVDYVYVNFENDTLLNHVFERDFDINRILMEIQLVFGKKITNETLLLFDELQEAKRGITALKYFYESCPQQPIIAAGSLLGLAMHGNDSFPVGKVDFLTIYPMSFMEFVEAVGKKQLIQPLKDKRWDVITSFASHFENLLRQYYYVGGMPEVVQCFVNTSDMQQVRNIQQSILDSYDRDVSKHAPINEVPRIRMIWNSVIGQLAKENKKFIYGFVKEGARAKNFELAIEWLKDAGLIYKIHRTKKGVLPLKAFEDFAAFKIYILDIGLFGAMANMSAQTIIEGNRLFTDFKGALTEQYVMQELRLRRDRTLYYWSADNSQGEIDFLIQQDEVVIPIEVKAEENLQSKSLRLFVERNVGLHGVRFSMSPFREQNWMTNYPLYSVETAI